MSAPDSSPAGVAEREAEAQRQAREGAYRVKVRERSSVIDSARRLAMQDRREEQLLAAMGHGSR